MKSESTLNNSLKQLPPDIEAQVEPPLQIAIAILQSLGVTNPEIQDQLMQAAAGVSTPVARAEKTIESQLISNTIKALNHLGYTGEARVLQSAQDAQIATWNNAAAAVLFTRGPEFLHEAMTSFSNSMRQSGTARKLITQGLNEWRRTNPSTATAVAQQEASAPPAWYPDPSGEPGLRWWDGHRWTDHRSP